jgi:hypothetical protein
MLLEKLQKCIFRQDKSYIIVWKYTSKWHKNYFLYTCIRSDFRVWKKYARTLFLFYFYFRFSSQINLWEGDERMVTKYDNKDGKEK